MLIITRVNLGCWVRVTSHSKPMRSKTPTYQIKVDPTYRKAFPAFLKRPVELPR